MPKEKTDTMVDDVISGHNFKNLKSLILALRSKFNMTEK